METLVYWTRFDYEEWTVTLAATEKGLCYVGVAKDSVERMKDWLKRISSDEIVEDAVCMGIYIDEIKAYLSGMLTSLSLITLDVVGTPFQHQVWEMLRQVPYGETVTYSDIADRLGKPSSVRAVASAIGKNPVLLAIPCHRVIAKSGDLSGYRDGKEQKAQLILLERRVMKNGEIRM
ncbi:methylated-DNA--[protein]-cysteine S-methyltransferase [Sporosarcina ureae]|uniref:methylated-DNA--[protein]-cysteine S-methyltransferase n=1 Tax=Sporosarcina ureae TaxID=1571 RepID=UPI0028AC4CB8|nr:methylated-DNA--[protein]-cysteine S-methyltransferase [Sporosarcina ureae]